MRAYDLRLWHSPGLLAWLRGLGPMAHRAEQARTATTASGARRYKYQALVVPLPRQPGDDLVMLPGSECRMAVCTRHSGADPVEVFGALVATSTELPSPGHLIVTLTVLDDHGPEHFRPGQRITLWRGNNVAQGTVSRRLFT